MYTNNHTLLLTALNTLFRETTRASMGLTVVLLIRTFSGTWSPAANAQLELHTVNRTRSVAFSLNCLSGENDQRLAVTM